MTRQYLVPAVKRAFEVIELLAKHETSMSISEIHRALRLPLSSSANIVYTLKSLGYLERDEEDARYRLSAKMLGISRYVMNRMDFLKQCHGLLEKLVRESGLTAHVAVMRGGESVYLDRVARDGLVQFSSYVGMRWPAHSSAVGKALVAFLPDAEMEGILRQMRLTKMTTRTITSRGVLRAHLRSFRRSGYTWEMEEGEMGVACVAAPLFGPDGRVVAAVSVTGTTNQIPRKKIAAIGALVKRYGHLMSARLGARPVAKKAAN